MVNHIFPDWKLQSRCLQSTFLPDLESLQSALKEWDLPVMKLTCLMTDNRANIIAAVRQLDWPLLNCFGHNLHLGITKSITDETHRTSQVLGFMPLRRWMLFPELAEEAGPYESTDQLKLAITLTCQGTCFPFLNNLSYFKIELLLFCGS